MHEPDFTQRDPEAQSPIRNFFGVCLIVLGVAVAAWLVISVLILISNGEMPGLVLAIVPDPGDVVTIDSPGGEITLPREVFTPIGFLLAIIAYGIVSGVAATLIKGGTSLLQPDLGNVLRRLLDRLESK